MKLIIRENAISNEKEKKKKITKYRAENYTSCKYNTGFFFFLFIYFVPCSKRALLFYNKTRYREREKNFLINSKIWLFDEDNHLTPFHSAFDKVLAFSACFQICWISTAKTSYHISFFFLLLLLFSFYCVCDKSRRVWKKERKTHVTHEKRVFSVKKKKNKQQAANERNTQTCTPIHSEYLHLFND